jgi:TatD DNase family protein
MPNSTDTSLTGVPGHFALLDSHAHLADTAFDWDRDEVIRRSTEKGVNWIVSPGVDLGHSRKTIAVAEEYEGVFAAVGISPHDAKDAREGDYDALAALARHPRVVAWGEIGLDFHHAFSDRKTQESAFRRQLRMAAEADLPVVLHFRDAAPDFFAILEQEGLPDPGGVMHCFTGTREEMALALGLGLHLSFAGMVTFRKSTAEFAELIARVPDNRLLVETDAPYLAPQPYRGRRSEPYMLVEVVKRVAEVRGMDLAQAARLTRANACRLFRLDRREEE